MTSSLILVYLRHPKYSLAYPPYQNILTQHIYSEVSSDPHDKLLPPTVTKYQHPIGIITVDRIS